jgi:hypothetical protein
MIYQISGAFCRKHWEIRCVGDFIPKGKKLGEVERAGDPFDYQVFLDESMLTWGDDIFVCLLNHGRYLISRYITKQQQKIRYNDLGQL